MTRFQKITLVWFIIYMMAFMTLIFTTSSCTTGRVGCPINAQHGFGPGRIR
jgi:hypothetical protein